MGFLCFGLARLAFGGMAKAALGAPTRSRAMALRRLDLLSFGGFLGLLGMVGVHKVG